jgi:hypothetical protein
MKTIPSTKEDNSSASGSGVTAELSRNTQSNLWRTRAKKSLIRRVLSNSFGFPTAAPAVTTNRFGISDFVTTSAAVELPFKNSANPWFRFSPNSS